ncbi:MAG TPA: YggT family protein [Holophagaceae bacterium]|nr:YggT family protein [Holophagaceae bacterium]
MPNLAILVYHGINALSLLVVVWALLSWFHLSRANPLVRTLDAIVEPILYPFQKLIPPIGGVSFAALAAILVLNLIKRLIVQALQG